MAEIRARECSTAIPPPGTAVPVWNRRWRQICLKQDGFVILRMKRDLGSSVVLYLPHTALWLCTEGEHTTLDSPHHDGSLSMRAQTAPRYFPAGPRPSTILFVLMNTDTVPDNAACTHIIYTGARIMSFSAGSVTSGARTQHNFSATCALTTCRCDAQRSSSSGVQKNDSEGRLREEESQVQRERKGKERVIGRAQRPHSAIARLTLQSAQQHRVWEASLLTTFLGPTDSAVISTMREAGVRYHNEVQAADSARREQLGPPHVHVFGAMITSLITQTTQITP